MLRLQRWNLAYRFHSIVWRFMRQAVELEGGSYLLDDRQYLLSQLEPEILRPAGSVQLEVRFAVRSETTEDQTFGLET